MNFEGLLKHIFRLGEVTAIYDDTGHIQVTFYDRDDEPRDVPMFSWFHEYNMPDIKDTVLCVFLPFDHEGFCLGKWFSETEKPKSGIKRSTWFKKFRHNADAEYNELTETFTLNSKNLVLNCENITINGKNFTNNGEKMSIIAKISQKGDFSQDGNFSTNGTIHGIGQIKSDTDVIANTISQIGHIHLVGGVPSTPPQ